MMKLSNKDTKTAIVNVSYMFKDLKKNITIIRKEIEEDEMILINMKSTISCIKIYWK